MTPFLRSVLRVGTIVTAAFERVSGRSELLFRSKAEAARRASAKFETLKRKEMEVERLDCLRNPGNYRGRQNTCLPTA
jgi:hypothetical protein